MLTTRASAGGLPALKSSMTRLEDTAENSLLFAPHRGCHAPGTARMIVAEDVQCPVHHQSKQFLAGADALSARVVAGNLGADIYVADDGSAPADPSESEGDDVGRPMVAKIAAIQP